MASSSRKCRQSLFCRIGLDDIAISKSRLEDDVSLFVELRKFSLEFIVDIERFFGGESVGMPAFASSFFDVVGIGAFEEDLPVLRITAHDAIEFSLAVFDFELWVPSEKVERYIPAPSPAMFLLHKKKAVLHTHLGVGGDTAFYHRSREKS